MTNIQLNNYTTNPEATTFNINETTFRNGQSLTTFLLLIKVTKNKIFSPINKMSEKMNN